MGFKAGNEITVTSGRNGGDSGILLAWLGDRESNPKEKWGVKLVESGERIACSTSSMTKEKLTQERIEELKLQALAIRNAEKAQIRSHLMNAYYGLLDDNTDLKSKMS